MGAQWEAAPVDPALVVESFIHYLWEEGGQASQAEFISLRVHRRMSAEQAFDDGFFISCH